MKTDVEMELFEIQLIKVDLENLRTRTTVESKNSTETENIFRQIASELERAKAVEKLPNPDATAQLSEIRYIKNELQRLLHKLESEISSDKTSQLLHKLMAKIRG